MRVCSQQLCMGGCAPGTAFIVAAHRDEEQSFKSWPSRRTMGVHAELYPHLRCRPWRGMLAAGSRSSPRRAAPAT